MSKLIAKKTALAVSKQAMGERLAAMRQDIGLETKDSRTVHMLCSATGRPFSVTFMRRNQGERFQIERINSESAAGHFGSASKAPKEKIQSFSAKEFDLAGFACPHCGHKGRGAVADFFSCQCEKLQCGARIRVVINVTHAACHDGCGRTGILSRRLESFSGDERHSKEGRKTLSGPSAKRLSGPNGIAPAKFEKK